MNVPRSRVLRVVLGASACLLLGGLVAACSSAASANTHVTAHDHPAANTGAPAAAIGNNAALGSHWGTRTAASLHTAANGVRTWHLPGRVRGFMTPAIGPNGSIWIGEMDSNGLAALDPQSNTYQELSFGSVQTNYQSTMGLAVGKDGTVWIAQAEVSGLARFNPRTGAYKDFTTPTHAVTTNSNPAVALGGICTPTSGSAPNAIAIDSSGNIWTTELGVNKLAKFDPRTDQFTEYPLPGTSGAPYWLAIGPNGNIWFTDIADGLVGQLNPATGAIHDYPLPANENPTGIAIDHSGNVWVGTVQGRLIDLHPSGKTAQVVLQKNVHSPVYGIAIASNGAVWFGTTGSNAYQYVPGTHTLVSYRLDAAPWWPVIGPKGHLWFALSAPGGDGIAEIP